MVTVPKLIVKLVPATRAFSNRDAGSTFVLVLQVTPNFVPSVSSSCTKICELAVTAVVLTVQVAPVALVAQEKCPAEAEPQAATDGLAADPTAAQFVSVPKLYPTTPPVVFAVGAVEPSPAVPV